MTFSTTHIVLLPPSFPVFTFPIPKPPLFYFPYQIYYIQIICFIYLLYSSVFTSFLFLRCTPFIHFPNWITYILLFPSLLLPFPLSCQWPCFTCQISVVTTGYMYRARSSKSCAYLLGLDYLTQYECFIILSIYM